MFLSNIFDIERLSRFYGFIEIVSFILYLDSFLSLYFSCNLISFTEWSRIVGVENIGIGIVVLLIYGIYRIFASTIICVVLFFNVNYFILLFSSKKYKYKKERDDDFVSIRKAEIIAVEENNMVLESRIKSHQSSKNVALDNSCAAINLLILFAVNFFCDGSIRTIMLNSNIFVLILIILFILLLVYVLVYGYKTYFQEDFIYYKQIENNDSISLRFTRSGRSINRKQIRRS